MDVITYFLGVDIGGTHIDGVCIDRDMRIVKRVTVPLPPSALSKKTIIDNVFKCLDMLCRGRKPPKPGCIGAAVPGAIKDGVVMKSPNLPFLDSVDFRSMLSRRYGTKVLVDNDVNCMAFGEHVRRKQKNLVAITLGTGIGSGIVIDGRVYRGRSFAGEIGHMTIEFDGTKCSCGNIGCFEEYASARSVRRLSWKHLGNGMEPHDAFRLAKDGNAKAMLVWEEYGKVLGVAMTNIALILDPDIIVLGGGISKAYEFFRDSMEAEMKKRLFIPMPNIVLGKPNGNAFGAACMALKA
ncbi:MAG: ROK family protein [Candidatus Aenigmarchaeota archaeon]|nr:ROK family protein [Candidatus Aenigmarchaeota archaeon]